MTLETTVMIAGGGPVGLTLGLALSHRGVRCLIAEANETTTRHPKMDVTNCRSMELYRALGVAGRLRAAAVPADHNMDVSWVTDMSGYELYRFRYPGVDEARQRFRAVNDGSSPLEPNMRISQVILEPLLRDILLDRRGVEIRYGWVVESFEQDAEGVTTTIRDRVNGATEAVRSRYLAGCDGGHSTVRRQLGIGLDGVAGTRPRYMVHFRSSARHVLQRWGIAWHYQSPVHGVLICQDDEKIWTLQAPIPPGADPADDLDPRDLLKAFLGADIDAEILRANAWVAHLLLAEAYRDGRVFLAGDSAHQYIPTGGYGMNTGVGDAFDLAWKIDWVERGWGGEMLLESYERERRPVGLRNREAARKHAETKGRIAKLWDERLQQPGPEGDRLREEVGGWIAAIGNAENESLGIEMGYRHDDSPVIWREPGAAPPLDDLVYRPGTRPGSRLPSLFLDDGRALYDCLGPGFTLIARAGVDAEGFADAARSRTVPLEIVTTDDANALAVLERNLVLVRPDHCVAWRGDEQPDDPGAVIDTARGA